MLALRTVIPWIVIPVMLSVLPQGIRTPGVLHLCTPSTAVTSDVLMQVRTALLFSSIPLLFQHLGGRSSVLAALAAFFAAFLSPVLSPYDHPQTARLSIFSRFLFFRSFLGHI